MRWSSTGGRAGGDLARPRDLGPGYGSLSRPGLGGARERPSLASLGAAASWAAGARHQQEPARWAHVTRAAVVATVHQQVTGRIERPLASNNSLWVTARPLDWRVAWCIINQGVTSLYKWMPRGCQVRHLILVLDECVVTAAVLPSVSRHINHDVTMGGRVTLGTRAGNEPSRSCYAKWALTHEVGMPIQSS